MSLLGQTINVMTLGGLALAVGILVDDATVEIENTHRNMAMKKPLVRAVLDGAQQIAAPAFVSTLSICIVFVPVLLLTGAAKYLFTPLAMAVVFAMLASYLLSRTLIPTMVHYMLRPEVKLYAQGAHGETAGGTGLIWTTHYVFNRRFERMRVVLHGLLRLVRWIIARRCWPASRVFVVAFALPGRLHRPRFLSRPSIPARCGCMPRAPVRHAHRSRPRCSSPTSTTKSAHVIPPREIDTIIDNIGIPNSGFNLAFGDNPHHRRRPTARS